MMFNVDDNIRVIQYLGSKMRISNYILNEIDRITPQNGVVADVFSGSGVVAYKLANKYKVYANDVQEYCRIINTALLTDVSEEAIPSIKEIKNSSVYRNNRQYLEELFKEPLEKERRILVEKDYEQLVKISQYGVFYDKTNLDNAYEDFNKWYFGSSYDLFETSRIEKAKSSKEYMLFSLYYLNSFFSLEQCIEIDSLKAAIDSMSTNQIINGVLTACLLHAVSEVVCSVGKNFAQPMKLLDSKGDYKKVAISRCFRDRTKDLSLPFGNMYASITEKNKPISQENIISCDDALSFIDSLKKGEVDTFYLDPPYTIDHYSRFYHILETLVLYDYPELEKKKLGGRVVILNGRYRVGRYQSSFCIPSKSLEEFTEMIKRIRAKEGNIIMSYSDSEDNLGTRKRVVSLEDLYQILHRYYNNVEVKRLDHRYRKLSEKLFLKEEMKDGEILFICR